MHLHEKPRPIVVLALCLMVATVFGLYLHDASSHNTLSSAQSDYQASFAEISTTSLPFGVVRTSADQVDVPILVYHVIRPSYPDDSAAVKRIALTPEVFTEELDHLRAAHYHIITFADLEHYFDWGTPLPTKPIILSFDDGWHDQFEYAFPILQKDGITATFFVFTNSIGRKGFLTLDNLKALRDAGMNIGSHSRSHPYLTRITSPAALSDEIVGSKQLLEQTLGITVNEFAYPFGQYTPAIAAEVKAAGYASARGDFYSGEQSPSNRYGLSAMNAPTTLAKFTALFP